MHISIYQIYPIIDCSKWGHESKDLLVLGDHNTGIPVLLTILV